MNIFQGWLGRPGKTTPPAFFFFPQDFVSLHLSVPRLQGVFFIGLKQRGFLSSSLSQIFYT
jgi:hypothetical protein